MNVARWIAVAFGLVQVAAYDMVAYPPGLRTAAFVTVGALAAGNVGFVVATRTLATVSAARRLAVASLVFDTLVAAALTWIYAFDPVSALFAILFLLPIEGALHFQLAGALGTWAGVAVLYAGREWFGIRYGNPWEWPSLTFRVGLLGIVALFVGLLARDLVRQRELTARALEESRRAEEWRARLVAMLAHDVRAPLAMMRTSFLTIAEQAGSMPAATIQRLGDAGTRQADRALLLARDLLDMAQLEAGTLAIAPEAVRLRQAVAAVEAMLPTEDADIEIEIPDDLRAEADPARLEQILHNLLGNALRHGRPPVHVTASLDDGQVELRIRDHGPGVAADVRVFEPFAVSAAGSVGLGTWAAGQLIEAHGGSVTYRNVDPGAEFTVRLPAAGPPGA